MRSNFGQREGRHVGRLGARGYLCDADPAVFGGVAVHMRCLYMPM